MESTTITLRPANAEDETFLRALYADTRAAELDAWGFDEAQRRAFLDLQFRAQKMHYETHFADAEHCIVLLADRPIGRMIVRRDHGEIYLADIALVNDTRDRGIGTLLVNGIQAEAAQSTLPLRLQVAQSSRAVGFYERLGFKRIQDRGTHFLMEWLPRGIAVQP